MRRFARIVGGAIVLAALLGGIMAVLRRLMPSVGDEDSDELVLAAVLNGIELHSHATSFRGGSATAIMGGIQLDLRDARLAPTGAHLRLSATVGGIQLIVPTGWRLGVAGSRAVMGGISLPAVDEAGEAAIPELQLICRALCGGIEVKTATSEE